MTDDHQRTPHVAVQGMLASKLRPTIVRMRAVPARLGGLLQPRPGCLTLLHAGAGYGKTTALAASHRGDWTWYNVDATDRDPETFARRLSAALGLSSSESHDASIGEVLALDLAQRLEGRTTVVTLDRWEQLGDAPEVGRFLAELLVAAPGLALRVATRTRPALPRERLRLEGRLIEVGPSDLRLDRDEMAGVLDAAWGRPPDRSELDFAESMLDGWPAALQLWQGELGPGGDPMVPLQPGQPLHEYIHEEVLGTLPEVVLEHVRRDWRWLVGRGPLVRRASNLTRREVADRLVRDRVGVVPGRQGWCLHPLVMAFAGMHTARGTVAVPVPAAPPVEAEPERPGAEGGSEPARRLVIRTFGGLAVIVDGAPIVDSAWPAAARRLLELFLSLPGCGTTAHDAARALWPSHPPRASRNSFNVALHGLRRALEADLVEGTRSQFVVREGRQYRLCLERLQCDAEEFSRLVGQAASPLDETGARRLQAAVDLHSGDFLAGCDEEFAEERRVQLRSLLLASLEELGQWYASRGRSEQAVPLLQRLVAMEPGRHEAWERLLELHDSSDGPGHLASTG